MTNLENIVVEKNSNKFKRFYGNFMAAIATWFIKRCLGYADSYVLAVEEEDFTGIPTMACICGCKVFRLNVMWDEEERTVGWYDLRQECYDCGTFTTAPTPIDNEGMDCV